MHNTKSDNRFYVYEWYNVDTGEVFYVGKGCGSRYKNTSSRNKFFKNYHNKYNCNVRKVYENISETNAYELEEKLIDNYQLDSQCQCNLLAGGTGGLSNPKNEKSRISRRIMYRHSPIIDNIFDYGYEELMDMSLERLQELESEFELIRDGKGFLESLFDKDVPQTYEWWYDD